MSKLSFRARTLDANKPVAVYRGDEIPDQLEFGAANRSIVEMPTGMEKEEESEHHLQRALNAQQVYGSSEVLVIPIPDMGTVGGRYNKLYASRTGVSGFKPPKQYIHVQPPGVVEQEIPEYDMDSEDEQWLNSQVKSLKMDVPHIKFENMLDRLEKGSGQMVVTLSEAKALLKEDDELTIAVYDYWLNKRLKQQHALIPQVRGEKRDGSTTVNPYVAFRRRTERMQTRKNRKNDEWSYEKMLKLRRHLNKALLLLEMLKRREKNKKELLNLTFEVYEQRYKCQDWEGRCLMEAKTFAKRSLAAAAAVSASYLPTPAAPAAIQSYHSNSAAVSNAAASRQDWERLLQEDNRARRKREYKKRKHKPTSSSTATVPSAAVTGGVRHVLQQQPQQQQLLYRGVSSAASLLQRHQQLQQQQQQLRLIAQQQQLHDVYNSSVDEDSGMSGSSGGSDQETETDPDGVYAFRRKANCSYLPVHKDAVGGDWPWSGRRPLDPSSTSEGLADPSQRPHERYRYRLTAVSLPPTSQQQQQQRCIGYARRRAGRGGRVLLDRAGTSWDSALYQLDPSLLRHPRAHKPEPIHDHAAPFIAIGSTMPFGTVKSEPCDVKPLSEASATSISTSASTVGTTNLGEVPDTQAAQTVSLDLLSQTVSPLSYSCPATVKKMSGVLNSSGASGDSMTALSMAQHSSCAVGNSRFISAGDCRASGGNSRVSRGDLGYSGNSSEVICSGSSLSTCSALRDHIDYIRSNEIPFYHQVCLSTHSRTTLPLSTARDTRVDSSSTSLGLKLDECSEGQSEDTLEGRPCLKRLKHDPDIDTDLLASCSTSTPDPLCSSTVTAGDLSGSSLGLSTLPADNILLLNYPIPPTSLSSSNPSRPIVERTAALSSISTLHTVPINQSSLSVRHVSSDLPSKTGPHRPGKTAASKVVDRSTAARVTPDSVVGALVGRGLSTPSLGNITARYQGANQLNTMGTFPPNVVATLAQNLVGIQAVNVTVSNRHAAPNRLPTVMTSQGVRLPVTLQQQQQLFQHRQQQLLQLQQQQNMVIQSRAGDVRQLAATQPGKSVPHLELHPSASSPALSQVVLTGLAGGNTAGISAAHSVVTFTRTGGANANAVVQSINRTNRNSAVGISTAGGQMVVGGALLASSQHQQLQQQQAMLKLGGHTVTSRTNSLARDTRDDLVATTTKDTVVAMEVT